MTLSIQENVSLQSYNTLSLPGVAEYFVSADSIDDIQQAVRMAAAKQWPITLLGGGSNLVLAADLPGLVIHIAVPGLQLVHEAEDRVQLRVGAGENWHQLVQKCLESGWYGLENLSLIPGTVGAAPVQNIGAYGVELSDRLVEVEVVDLDTAQRHTFNCSACQFGYRDSVFKRDLKGKVAIVSVTLELLKQPELQLSYPSLQKAVEKLQQESGSEVLPQDVGNLVCQIRQSKLPDPEQIPNAGSFFKNPVVSSQLALNLQQKYPGMVTFPAPGGQMKLAAGWLIEQAGWKGRAVGDIAVHDKQALVLVNRGGGTGEQLLAVADDIVRTVKEMFDVTLEVEPRILPE